MKIQPNGSKPSAKGPEDYFTGTVRIDAPFKAEELGRVEGAYVTFEPVPALPGTPTRWDKHSLSPPALAGYSVKAGWWRKFAPAMWSGSRLAKSTGTVLRRRLLSPTSPSWKARTARTPIGWKRSAMSNTASDHKILAVLCDASDDD